MLETDLVMELELFQESTLAAVDTLLAVLVDMLSPTDMPETDQEEERSELLLMANTTKEPKTACNTKEANSQVKLNTLSTTKKVLLTKLTKAFQLDTDPNLQQTMLVNLSAMFLKLQVEATLLNKLDNTNINLA